MPATRSATGARRWRPEEEEAAASAIHAALFGVGRLQPLLDNPDVENVDINGCDRVFVGYSDGREELHEPVAETDEELVELIQVLAANVGLTSRPFDAANPQLDLRLPDGSRLSAVMGVCSRPSLSASGARAWARSASTISSARARCRARSRRSCGPRCVRPDEHDDRRLDQLRQDDAVARARQRDPAGRTVWSPSSARSNSASTRSSDLHPNVVAFEERLPNSEGLGGVSMAELVRRSLRMNPSRVIVGEVLGDEIVTMLNAMSQGNDGSLSTIHANSSMEVFNRISTYALQSAENLPVEATHMLIAGSINFVVFLRKRNEYETGGTLVRAHREHPRGHRRGRPGAVQRGLRALDRGVGAVPHAPIACIDELRAVRLLAGMRERWVWT